jgi:ketosteroid isomerase-like protein
MGDRADTAGAAARNRQIVAEYREAFGTFDPDAYTRFLAPEPTYHAGMTKRVGQGAYHQNTGAGRVLYPHGALRTEARRVIADGDWVAQLVDREAITNKGAHYENVYGMFFELRDGLITTQVELMDFRVSTEKFDLSVLDPALMAGGVQAPPDAVAPDPTDDGTPAAANKRLVLDFLDVFLTFDPPRYEHLLTDDPTHQVGMSRRSGREGFRDIATHGRRLYPQGIADRTIHALLGEGDDVAVLSSMRAVTNKGVDYENVYGMFFEIDDGRIASMTELLDNRVAAAKFDLS